MKSIAQFALQAAFAEIIVNDPELITLMPGGLFDGEVPAQVKLVWPYAVIGGWTEHNDDRLATLGARLTFLVQVFSQYEGTKEAATITNRIVYLLSRRRIPAEDWNITDVRFNNSINIVIADAKRCISTRFFVKCQPLP